VLALLFHGVLLAGFLWGPRLFETKAKVQIPYTVQLFEPGFGKSEKKPGPVKVQKTQESPKLAKPPATNKPKLRSHAANKKKIQTPKPKHKPEPEKKISKVRKKKAVSLNTKVKKKKNLEKEKKKTTKSVKSEQKNRKIAETKVAQRIKEIQRRLKEREREERLKRRLAELEEKLSREKGSSRKTGAGGISNRQGSIYGEYVKAKVRRNWHFPLSLADRKDLETVVNITVAKNGRILDIRVTKYSGNAAFDRSVIKAVRASAPFEPFPRTMQKDFEEIEIRFNPKDKIP